MKDVWHDKFRLFSIDPFWNVNNVTYGKVAGQVQFHTKIGLGKWNKTFLPKNKNENNKTQWWSILKMIKTLILPI